MSAVGQKLPRIYHAVRFWGGTRRRSGLGGTSNAQDRSLSPSPNILLSGFMFPFAGMPIWAQWIGEALPLTHYLRIVRSIMLKGSGLSAMHNDAAALFVLTLVAMGIAVTRFRRTLD